jgi:hypothetical protein
MNKGRRRATAGKSFLGCIDFLHGVGRQVYTGVAWRCNL